MKTDYLHIKVPDELKEKLKREASKKGLSLNSFIRMALIEFLGNNKNEE